MLGIETNTISSTLGIFLQTQAARFTTMTSANHSFASYDNYTVRGVATNGSEIPWDERVYGGVALLVICLLAVSGNLTLWIVVIRTPELHTAANSLLLCLSAADLLVSIINMPLTVVTIFIGRWVFSDAMCVATGFSNMLTFVGSVMSLCLITLNRYIRVCRPHRYRVMYGKKAVALHMSGVWLLSTALSMPPLFGWSEYRYLETQFFCYCSWRSSLSYTIFMVAFCFGGTSSLMTSCYVAIYRKFMRSKRVLTKQANAVTSGGRNSNRDGTPDSRSHLSLVSNLFSANSVHSLTRSPSESSKSLKRSSAKMLTRLKGKAKNCARTKGSKANWRPDNPKHTFENQNECDHNGEITAPSTALFSDCDRWQPPEATETALNGSCTASDDDDLRTSQSAEFANKGHFTASKSEDLRTVESTEFANNGKSAAYGACLSSECDNLQTAEFIEFAHNVQFTAEKAAVLSESEELLGSVSAELMNHEEFTARSNSFSSECENLQTVESTDSVDKDSHDSCRDVTGLAPSVSQESCSPPLHLIADDHFSDVNIESDDDASSDLDKNCFSLKELPEKPTANKDRLEPSVNRPLLHGAVTYADVTNNDKENGLKVEANGVVIPRDMSFLRVTTLAHVTTSASLSSTNARAERRRREEIRLTSTMLLVILVYVISWLPYSLMILVTNFLSKSAPKEVDMLTLLMGYANSLYNPFIYGWRNNNIRRGYIQLYRDICDSCVCRNRQSARSQTVVFEL